MANTVQLKPARLMRTTTFAALLAEWGTHEGRGRLKAELDAFSPDVRRRLPLAAAIEKLDSTDAHERFIAGVEVAMIYRSPLVRRILERMPNGECIEAEIEAEHAERLWNFDFSPFDPWRRALTGKPRQFIDSLKKEHVLGGGPLIAVARSLSGPFALIDGNHRAAAWAQHQDAGERYPLRLGLIAVEGMPSIA